jgi:hypothetical protein
MKVLMVIAALMMVAGIALDDVVLGVCGLVSLSSAATHLLAQRIPAQAYEILTMAQLIEALRSIAAKSNAVEPDAK